jgi:hypothetical protein
VSEQVFIERKLFNYIQFVHKYFPVDLPGRGLAWAGVGEQQIPSLSIVVSRTMVKEY